MRFLPTTFAGRGPQPRKQRPSFSDHGSHFTRKNTGLRARKSFQAWTQAFPTCYTSQLLDDDGDDDDGDDDDGDDDDDGNDDDDDGDDGDDGDDVIATMVRKLAMTILSNKFPLII